MVLSESTTTAKSYRAVHSASSTSRLQVTPKSSLLQTSFFDMNCANPPINTSVPLVSDTIPKFIRWSHSAEAVCKVQVEPSVGIAQTSFKCAIPGCPKARPPITRIVDPLTTPEWNCRWPQATEPLCCDQFAPSSLLCHTSLPWLLGQATESVQPPNMRTVPLPMLTSGCTVLHAVKFDAVALNIGYQISSSKDGQT